MVDRIRVMVVCTRNSCRSQMAEGWLRHLAGDRLEVYSAGIEAGGIDLRAVQVMDEVGVDIAGHNSCVIDVDLMAEMDYVVTVCSEADAACPLTPATVTRRQWPVDDPAGVVGDEQTVLQGFRRIRDELRQLIECWLTSVGQ